MKFNDREEVEKLSKNLTIGELMSTLESLEKRIKKTKLVVAHHELKLYERTIEKNKHLSNLSDYEHAERRLLLSLSAKQRGIIP